jgi:transposase
MNTHHLGIDVAKAKLDCALRRPDGKFRSKVLANSSAGFEQLAQWLAAQQARDVHVCMEATGVYWEPLAQFLAERGLTVSVTNPAQLKAYAASCLSRSKTDALDARLIAQFCSERHPAPWQPPSEAEQTLRALVLRLDALQGMRTQEANRLGVAREAVRPGIEQHIDWLDHEIRQLAEAIRQHIDSDPDLREKARLLATVPGLGERTVAILLAYVGQPERFANVRKVAAFAGLSTRLHESGSSVKGKPHLSKLGHSFLRKALYFPAIVALYRTAWGRPFQQRLKAAGKPNKLIIGAMMRKLLHVAYGVLKSGKPFDPNLHGA